MTRFARAKGSKASNEKKPGEATSWAEMKKGMVTKNTSKPSEENSLKVEQTNKSKLSGPPKKAEWATLKNSPSLNTSYLKRKNESESGNEGGGKNNKMMKKQSLTFNNKDQNSKDSAKLNSNNNTSKNLSEGGPQGEKKDLSKLGKKTKKKKKKMLAQKSLNESNNSEIKESSSNSKPEMLNQSNDEKNNLKNVNRSDNFVGNKKNKKRKLIKEGEEDKVVKKNKKMSDSEDVKNESEDWDPVVNEDSELTKSNGKQKSGFNKKGLGKGGRNHKNVKQNTTVTEETLGSGEKVKIVKFQGFPLMQDDAERLEKLKDDMIQKGLPQEKVDAVLKLERRKAEKSWKRLRKNVCFHCRGSGHYLSNCPALTENQNTGTGICYKCGSTEHCAFDCKVVKGSNFRFAECFICKEQGHIARQCPDNPRGLYPMGGACKLCGDVTHLKKDCPKVMEKKSEEILTVGVRKNEEALECLDEEIAKKEREVVKPKKKLSTVKF